jgi:hypothetical protein
VIGLHEDGQLWRWAQHTNAVCSDCPCASRPCLSDPASTRTASAHSGRGDALGWLLVSCE